MPGETQQAEEPGPAHGRAGDRGVRKHHRRVRRPAFCGCNFELVHGETEILPGISMFPTPGHAPGHMSVTVKVPESDIVLAGDAVFQARNLEPKEDEKWRYRVPPRFVNAIEGCGWRDGRESWSIADGRYR